jgi:hypothetical protein
VQGVGVAHKLMFTVPFYSACKSPLLCSSVVTPWGYKAGSHSCTQATSSCTIPHRLSTSFPTVEKKGRPKNRSRNKRELLSLLGVASPSLLNHGRVGLVCVGGHERALGVLQIPPSSPGSGGVEPLSKRVRPWSFLPVSFRYAHGVVRWFTPLLLLLFLF